MYNSFRPNKNIHKRFAHKSLPSADLIQAIRSVEVIQKGKGKDQIEEQTLHGGFADFHLDKTLVANILHKGYTIPTPIQDKAIVPILDGHDVIGVANTGTGKTAAFLIPITEKIFHNKTERAIIITPTRELALQIFEELKGFNRGMGMYTTLCIGGMSLNRQKSELRQNPHVVIGTPGRIKDLIGERALNLSQFGTVVLDEADRMVDIGFIQDIKYFISLLPVNRQSLFFSATISGKVSEILKAFVKNPVTVSVKKEETAENIHQDVIHVTDKFKKVDQLHNLLTEEGFDKVLIFGRTKWGVQRLTDELIKRGFRAGAIHGNKSQNHRQKVLDQFKRGELKILLATDVASRGLDIPDVTHVINYDMPENFESYVHRIGRTGRADKKGTALTFVDR